MLKNIYICLHILLIAGFVSLTGCGPCDGNCGGGTFCCPDPAGIGGICCISGKQVCASTGGRSPGPMCESIPESSDPLPAAPPKGNG